MQLRGRYKTSDKLLLLGGEKRVSTVWLWALRTVMLFFLFAWLSGQMAGFGGGIVELVEDTLVVMLLYPYQTVGVVVALVVVYAVALNGIADTEAEIASLSSSR